MSWVGLVFWAGSLCQDCPTTFRFFIKSLEEGRLVRPKYREKPQVAFVFAVLLFMSIFLSWMKQQDLAVVILYTKAI